MPHLSDNGRGVNHAELREPGVKRQMPRLSYDAGVNGPQLREPGCEEHHPMTMPKLTEWIEHLSARLRHVRILNGDWSRACTSGALNMLTVRSGKGVAGIFLDPPYANTADRYSGLYAHDDLDVAHKVREWCLANGGNPTYRIVLAGFEGEHGTALVEAGWTEIEWFRGGFLKGGMANTGKNGHSQARERLWLSPHCLPVGGTEPEPETGGKPVDLEPGGAPGGATLW
jgi:hypothetical protein